MPRPTKYRRVCCLPHNSDFGPVGKHHNNLDLVIMTVEEFETIRLIDYDGYLQEECANKMEVARTTVQRIYTSARKKLAQSLVESKMLKIEGGDYTLCNGTDKKRDCHKHCCHRRKTFIEDSDYSKRD